MRDKVISHYRIMEEIGAGGMGVVFKALDTRLDRIVAIKLLPPYMSTDRTATERFIREAKAASSLNHPNIGVVHEIDTDDEGRMFMVMAYYEGESLRERMDRGGVTVEETLAIVSQVAAGLAAAHSREIVHRDIKPSNILLTEDGRAVVIDFGLAKIKGRTNITTEGRTLGTVAYMSPEQVQGAEVDRQTDIFSLGVIFYELLCGRRPFGGEHEAALLFEIVNQRHTPVENIVRAAAKYGSVVDGMLEKDPRKRYGSAPEVIRALDCAREGRDARSKRGGWFRRTALVAALLVVLGALLLPDRIDESEDAVGGGISVAVLPFTDIVTDTDKSWLCDGITEDIITNLSRIEELRVISRTSVMYYKSTDKRLSEIAGELGVSHILEGSVRQVGDRIRITAQLIDASTDHHLWAETYDEDMSDIFRLQNDIAVKIAEVLDTRLSSAQRDGVRAVPTSDVEAYKLYLKGRWWWNRRYEDDGIQNIERAIEFFDEALVKDRGFALAYVGLADCHVILGILYNQQQKYEERDIAWQKSWEMVSRAIEIDDGLPEAYASRGTVRTYRFEEPYLIEADYLKSFEKNPQYATAHNWYAMFLKIRGRYEAALKEIERAAELDPIAFVSNETRGNILFEMKKYEQAKTVYENTLALHPETAQYINGELGVVALAMQEYRAALKHFDEMGDYNGDVAYVLKATAYARMGKIGEAHGLLVEYMRRRGEKMNYTCLAKAYFSLGETDTCFVMLHKAYERREIDLMMNYNSESFFGDIMKDPRFEELVSREDFH